MRFSGSQNPCPVCGKHEGSCQESKHVPHGVLCINPDAASDDWVKIKDLDGGSMGALMIPKWFQEEERAKWSQEKRDEWEHEQRRLAERQARELIALWEATQDNLGLGIRDQKFRLWLLNKPLFEHHRQNLRDRGLTNAQIEAGWFRSEKGYKNKPDEILCPVWHNGIIIGIQRRLDRADSGGKYKWPYEKKSPAPNKLKNGELPIAAIGTFKGVINFIEGAALKPFIAQSIHNGLFLGGSGGQIPPLLLRKSVAELGATEAVLWADAGSKLNQHVVNTYRVLRDRLSDLGVTLKVADWGQWNDKSAKDADEITPDTPVKFRPASDFFGELPKIVFDKATGKRIYTEEEKRAYRLKKDWEEWEKSYAFTGAKQLPGPYFGSDLSILPKEGEMFCGKGGLGTGKTKFFGKFVESKQDESIHIQGTRNALLEQTASDCGLLHLRSDDGFKELDSENNKLAYCLHSLPNLTMEQVENKWIALDEVTSVIRELFFSRTLRKKGNKSYKRVCELFFHGLATCKGIICLDAYLNNWTVEFLSTCAPHLKVRKYELRKDSPEQIFWHSGCINASGELNSRDKSDLHSILIDAALNGKNFTVASDSQKELEALQNVLNDGGIYTERIDSKTTADAPSDADSISELKGTKALLKKPNQFILKHRPQGLMTSPSCETGFNVDLPDYFDLQVCLFYGVLEADKLIQMTYRVRHCKERHIFCSQMGIDSGNYSGSNYYSVSKTDSAFYEQDIYDSLGVKPSITLDNPSDVFQIRAKARAGFELWNLDECLRKLFQWRGCEIIDVAPVEINEEVKAEIKAAKIFVKRQEAQGEVESPIITQDEAEAISRDNQATFADRLKARKFYLLKRLPGIEDDPIYGVDFVYNLRFVHKTLLTEINRWILLNDWGTLAHLHWFDTNDTITEGIPDPWSWRSQRAILHSIHELGILQDLKDIEFTNDSPEVLRIIARWTNHKPIAARLKKHPNKKDNIKSIEWVLSKVGIRLKSRREQKDGERVRVYSLDFSNHESPEWVACESRLHQSIKTRLDELINPPSESQSFTSEALEADEGLEAKWPDHTLSYKNRYDLTTSENQSFKPANLDTPAPPYPRNGIREDWVKWLEYLLSRAQKTLRNIPKDISALQVRCTELAVSLDDDYALSVVSPF